MGFSQRHRRALRAFRGTLALRGRLSAPWSSHRPLHQPRGAPGGAGADHPRAGHAERHAGGRKPPPGQPGHFQDRAASLQGPAELGEGGVQSRALLVTPGCGRGRRMGPKDLEKQPGPERWVHKGLFVKNGGKTHHKKPILK